MNDEVEHPSHYDFGPLEAREIIEFAIADLPDQVTGYHVASALKYLLRASRKGGTKDIAKARQHVGWAEDAAKAYEKREAKRILAEMAQESQRQGLYDIPPPNYDPEDVAFRHGDIGQVCGEFTQPPNCVHESTKSNDLGNVEIVDNAHPMHAEALRMADEKPCNRPSYPDPAAWSVTWPCYSALVRN